MQGVMATFMSICILSLFVLMGKFLRVKVKIFQKLFLPSSIIAGFIALLFGPYLLGGFLKDNYNMTVIPDWMFENWASLPGVLINVVFACLFLGVNIPGVRKIWNFGGPQLCFGVVAGMGQYFFGLLTTLLVLAPLFGVPPIFACILEIGFSGGHGTAAGMTETFTRMGFPAGGALAQMSATVGIIAAVVVGITLINLAIRKGYCSCLNEEKGIPNYKKVGLIPEKKRFSIATATVASEAIEPLTFHFAVVSISILIGWVMLQWIKSTGEIMHAFPLFPLAMIGGLIVQLLSSKLKIDEYYDKDTFDRILGFSLDILVISAIATIKLNLFLENFWPFMILMTVGIAWLVFCVVFLGPRMLPTFWFERSITEFGMQSGVTAVGLLLLRVVDPQYKTGTAQSFGFKQMVYEPFLGGGLITALAPIIVHSLLGPTWSIISAFIIMLTFILIAHFSGWTTIKPVLECEEQREL
jgi:glutamate:Na+ symporter, ESS family